MALGRMLNYFNVGSLFFLDLDMRRVSFQILDEVFT